MAESLLGMSEVLLFGREVSDLEIPKTKLTDAEHEATVATTKNVDELHGHPEVDGEAVADDDLVLVFPRHGDGGLYKVKGGAEDWEKVDVDEGQIVSVEKGNKLKETFWVARMTGPSAPRFTRYGKRRLIGHNQQLGSQLDEDDVRFARIYGFSYEGVYCELPNPTLFLVHGEGESATDGDSPGHLASRAPNDPSLSGVASAEYQIADGIRVWAYDKADYTIRMDVASGMFEQVLLDIFFGHDLPAMQGAMVGGGGNARGAMVSGAMVRGAMVRGAMVRGAMVRGGKNRD